MNGCGRILAPSIQTDVIDYDELMTGERKEGAYFAAWNFVQKTAVACSVLFTGLALEASGFVPNVDQNESAQQMIRLLLSAVPMLCIGAGSALFLPFGLGESEHAEIQRSLEASQRDREAVAPA
jgi:GPH family glycoside/pentoside/hexuronide:cation symporter